MATNLPEILEHMKIRLAGPKMPETNSNEIKTDVTMRNYIHPPRLAQIATPAECCSEVVLKVGLNSA